MSGQSVPDLQGSVGGRLAPFGTMSLTGKTVGSQFSGCPASQSIPGGRSEPLQAVSRCGVVFSTLPNPEAIPQVQRI